ncbi:hypothetical protein D5086_009247 [Populus alba]|uniref:Uncharacterized protein n=1 Tax=Populus alba TaxID=43335 RepID=A0ACC4CID8_POPAL
MSDIGQRSPVTAYVVTSKAGAVQLSQVGTSLQGTKTSMLDLSSLIPPCSPRITIWPAIKTVVFVWTGKVPFSWQWISHSSWTFYSASLLDYRARGGEDLLPHNRDP